MRTALRRAAIVAVLLLALPAALVLAAMVALQLPAVSDWAAGRAEAALSRPGARVALGGVDIRWPLDLRVARLAVDDPEGSWLTATDLALDWRPLRLLAGRFHVESLDIGEMRLLRQPAAAPADGREAGGDGAMPALPVAVRIDRLDAELEIAEPVLGTPARLHLGGEAALGAREMDIGLFVQRLDGVPAHGQIVAQYRLRNRELLVDARMEEPQGGLLARALNLPGLPPMQVNVEGGGPLTDWQGRFAVLAGNDPCLVGTAATTQMAGEPLTVTAQGQAQPRCIAPAAPVAEALGEEQVSFSLRAQPRDDRWKIERVQIKSGETELTGEGEYIDDYTFTFTLNAPNLARFEPLAGIPLEGAATFDVGIAGAPNRLALGVRVKSDGGGVMGWRWEDLDGTFRIVRLGGGDWSVAATGKVDLADEDLPPPLAGRLGFGLAGIVDRENRDVQLANFSLTSEGAHLVASGRLREWGADSSLYVTLAADRLDRLVATEAVTVNGRAVIQGRLRGDLPGRRLAVALTTRAAGFSTGIAAVDAIVGERPRAVLSAGIRNGEVPLMQARVQGEGATLRAGGRYHRRLTLGWAAELADLSALTGAQVELEDGVTMRGLVLGPVTDPRIASYIEAMLRPAPGYAPVRMKAGLGLEGLSPPAGRLRFGVKGEELVAEGRTGFVIGREAIRLRDLAIWSGDDRVEGDLTIDPADSALAGGLEGHFADLRPWSELAGVELGGSLSFDARLAAEAGQRLRLGLLAHDLVLPGATVRRLTAEADLADLLDQPSGTARATASGVAVGAANLERADVSARGTGRQLVFALDAEGTANQSPLRLAAGGDLRPEAERRVLTLDTLRVEYAGEAARLAEPAVLALDDGLTLLEPLVLSLREGRLRLAGALTPERLDARLEMAGLPLALLEPILPVRGAQGEIAGRAEFAGSFADPRVTVALTGRDVGFAAGREASVDLDLDALWQGGRVEAGLVATGGGRLQAEARASFPLVLAGNELAVPEEGAVDARLQGTADLGRIAGLLPLPDHRFDGDLSFQLALGGTVGDPRVGGTATLRNGFYENLEMGTVLRDASATMEARSARQFAIELRGRDGIGGQLQGQGRLAIDEAGLNYLVEASLANYRVVRMAGATALASGELRLEGLGADAALTGAIRVDRGDVNIAERLPSQIPSIDVVEVNLPPGRAPIARTPAESVAEPEIETPLTVALSIPVQVRRLIVYGRGLQSEWRGDLVVGGTASAPVVVGEINTLLGTFDLLGERFVITEGQIAFQGGRPIDPRLDMTAQASARDIVAEVNVGGTATAPRIDFTSTPPYPRDEIISRLLFGEEPGRLSVGQQIQLARLAATLTGRGGGLDPIGALRRNFGLDILEVGPGEAEDADGTFAPTVRAGKWLDSETLVTVEQGAAGGKVVVERQIGGGFTIDTELGERSGGGVGLKWRRDY